jgi:hypothetical protein
MATYKELVTTDLAEKGLSVFNNGVTKANLATITKTVNEYFEKYYLDSLKAKAAAVSDTKTLEDISVLIASK